jgi:uncharacterized DUF497 family protein
VTFEWDERKRAQIIRERGVDMVYAAQIFEGDALTRMDDRADYGEIRLITAWKGGRDERSQYQAGIARRNQENEGKG